ncbi:MAG: M20/M25/M40 family metallo-hydrolase, partial [Candidatus Heimdallarchaeota archaeon]
MDEKKLTETIELLQELIRNECVNPPGNEMKNIKTIAKFLENKGIVCKIFESTPNRGNLIAR